MFAFISKTDLKADQSEQNENFLIWFPVQNDEVDLKDTPKQWDNLKSIEVQIHIVYSHLGILKDHSVVIFLYTFYTSV